MRQSLHFGNGGCATPSEFHVAERGIFRRRSNTSGSVSEQISTALYRALDPCCAQVSDLKAFSRDLGSCLTWTTIGCSTSDEHLLLRVGSSAIAERGQSATSAVLCRSTSRWWAPARHAVGYEIFSGAPPIDDGETDRRVDGRVDSQGDRVWVMDRGM